ncbi:MAG: radical SAM protein [Deltaproteobacteria bacterium]|jgi:anaerobic ribonucleoside-triphosphate reductase activating protein|nr:radical SAM protein [Deltaproteobacteria bacterium]
MGPDPLPDGARQIGQTGRLRINGIVEESVVDGPGLRFVVFTQGCPHNCAGCHNPDTHRLGGGYVVETPDLLRQFRENPLLAGITFSGGEPFLQPAPLVWLAAQVRRLGKNVVTFTGFTYEKLADMSRERPEIGRLLDLSDILIDGPYLEDLRDLELQYRGSGNQRVLTLRDREDLRPGCRHFSYEDKYDCKNNHIHCAARADRV